MHANSRPSRIARISLERRYKSAESADSFHGILADSRQACSSPIHNISGRQRAIRVVHRPPVPAGASPAILDFPGLVVFDDWRGRGRDGAGRGAGPDDRVARGTAKPHPRVDRHISMSGRLAASGTTRPRSRACVEFPAWPAPARPSSARRSSRRTRADAFITLKGVDPVLEGQVTDIERTIDQGQPVGIDRDTGRRRATRHSSRPLISRSNSVPKSATRSHSSRRVDRSRRWDSCRGTAACVSPAYSSSDSTSTTRRTAS